MTSKEYFCQAYRLDERINSDLEELAMVRAMAGSLRSSAPRDRVQTSRRGEAAFVSGVERILALEQKIDREIDQLVDLREQMREVIDTVKNRDERMVLRYRYINGMTWERIGRELNMDERSARRWHSRALKHVALPEKTIVIGDEPEKSPEMSGSARACPLAPG